MKPESLFPLPERQYRRYVVVFHILMLGALIGALMLVLWEADTGLNWRQVVVALLLLLQIGLYVRVLALARDWPMPRRRLVLYFACNLGIWLAEYWLVPGIQWVVYAYIGQMFGLLPARYGLGAGVFVTVAVVAKTTGFDVSAVDADLLLGMVAVWASFLFLLYISHLTQTSQERGTLIAELEAAKAALEAAQRREAEVAVLRERERLARDLHDSLGHALVALSVQLEAVQRLYRVDPEQASAQVDEMKALTRSSMDALRRSLAGLRAPGLGDRALGPALQALCIDLGERTGAQIHCQIDEGVNYVNTTLAEALWRVTQEALTNVERHAQASRLQVSLACEPSGVVLRVRDDGIGLSPEAESSPDHFGLRGMRERVEGLGGTLSLRGDRDGTLVEACLPLIAAHSRSVRAGASERAKG
jgi:signal transduction histidine kinase